MVTTLTSKKVQLPVQEWTRVHFSTALEVSQEGGYVYVTWTETHKYPRREITHDYEKLFRGDDLIAPAWWHTSGNFSGDFHPNSTWDPSYYVPSELGKESLQETISRLDQEEKARHQAKGVVRVYRKSYAGKGSLNIDGRGFDHDFFDSHLYDAGFVASPGEEISLAELMTRLDSIRDRILSLGGQGKWDTYEVHRYLGYVYQMVAWVQSQFPEFFHPSGYN